MWISLWNPCARIVRIAVFHAQDSGRAIPRLACRTALRWRSFTRSVRVPRQAGETPRRPSRVLRPPADSGGETICAGGTKVRRARVEQPEPGARRFCGLTSARMFQARPFGRREASGSVWGCAGRNRPPLHRGRRFRVDRSPLPKDGDERPRGRTREGASAPRAGTLRQPLRGGWRNEDRQGTRSALDGAGRQVPGKGRLCEKPRRNGTAAGFPRRKRAVAAKRRRALPGEADRMAAGNVRRLLRIGSQAGSRGVRRCLAGHSHGPSRDRAT